MSEVLRCWIKASAMFWQQCSRHLFLLAANRISNIAHGLRANFIRLCRLSAQHVHDPSNSLRASAAFPHRSRILAAGFCNMNSACAASGIVMPAAILPLPLGPVRILSTGPPFIGVNGAPAAGVLGVTFLAAPAVHRLHSGPFPVH